MRRIPPPNYRTISLVLAVSVVLFICASPLAGVRSSVTLAQSQDEAAEAPFSVAIVPGEGGVLTLGRNSRDFYVVLTNISNEIQNTWEYWNSWGFQTLSFQVTLPNGQKSWATRVPQDFTRNFPSTFAIRPGEHEVFVIQFGKKWREDPPVPAVVQIPITIKAIYDVPSSPATVQHNVWTGRVESHYYQFVLYQW